MGKGNNTFTIFFLRVVISVIFPTLYTPYEKVNRKVK